ncbi:MAG: SEL1-like repeat protein [Bacteroidota bacterium]|nr:SEL1-like repeat protein [Bacteroidota bacterium]
MKRVILFLAICIMSLSYEQEVKDIIKNAEQGEANAQYLLGVAYWEGMCVEQSSTKAIHWLKKACEEGLLDDACDMLNSIR